MQNQSNMSWWPIDVVSVDFIIHVNNKICLLISSFTSQDMVFSDFIITIQKSMPSLDLDFVQWNLVNKR